MSKQKLELTWIGKGEEPTLGPCILTADLEKSCGCFYNIKIIHRLRRLHR